MNILRHSALFALLALAPLAVSAQQVDYSVVSVPEEAGIDFTRITSPSDYVCMPLVRRQGDRLNWLTNRILDISADGTYTENGVETAPHGTFPWSGSGRYTYNETAQLLTMIDSEENEPIYTKAVVSGNTLTIWDAEGDTEVYTRVISAPRQL